jgi:cholesterol oxidase
MSWDAVIVGSGFGGSVSACRLAEAGRKVLVLERGRRWAPQDYPRELGDAWVWDPDEPEQRNGWIDLRIMDQMWVAQGAGVGGGSLIYANISIDALPDVLASGWPSQIDAAGLAVYYDRVARMLGSTPLPDTQLTPRFRLMREAAEKVGAAGRFRKVDLAVTFDEDWRPDLPNATEDRHSRPWVNAQGRQQGTCVHCGNCDIGCQVRAKNTLDLNYLAAAEDSGAVIQPLALVSHLTDLGDRWRVHYDDLSEGRRQPRTIETRQVILAAGSLGSTEILLRSRDEFRSVGNLPKALGHGWSSNGDFLTPAFYEGRTIDPTFGPTITCAIDFLDGSEGGRFFVEDGGFPNVVANYVRERLSHKRVGRAERRLLAALGRSLGRNPLTNMMPWFGQAIDGGDGQLYLGRSLLRPWRRKLKLDWDPRRSEAGVGGLAAMHEKLSRATGGKPMIPSSWAVFRNLVTPHPLGGCNMATAPAHGVVDHTGAVFGCRGLHVLDGSIVPRPIGLNPSKTIAALAERATDIMLER